MTCVVSGTGDSPFTRDEDCVSLSPGLRARFLLCCSTFVFLYMRYKSVCVCVCVCQGAYGPLHHPDRDHRGGGDAKEPDGQSQQEGPAPDRLPQLGG